MNIRKAAKKDCKKVLQILDEFRSAVSKLIDPASTKTFQDAQDCGEELFMQTIKNPDAQIFVAEEGDNLVGILTIYKIPVLRKGEFRAEIEEMFVRNELQGKGISQMLMNMAKKWCKENNIKVITLESGNELSRAHSFYKKEGFEEYAKGFKFRIN